jgi:hypothetical protein
MKSQNTCINSIKKSFLLLTKMILNRAFKVTPFLTIRASLISLRSLRTMAMGERNCQNLSMNITIKKQIGTKITWLMTWSVVNHSKNDLFQHLTWSDSHKIEKIIACFERSHFRSSEGGIGLVLIEDVSRHSLMILSWRCELFLTVNLSNARAQRFAILVNSL